eukprot:scaffold1402_cov254-Pinguiococcus_pyrenoidosus.AAC.3
MHALQLGREVLRDTALREARTERRRRADEANVQASKRRVQHAIHLCMANAASTALAERHHVALVLLHKLLQRRLEAVVSSGWGHDDRALVARDQPHVEGRTLRVSSNVQQSREPRLPRGVQLLEEVQPVVHALAVTAEAQRQLVHLHAVLAGLDRRLQQPFLLLEGQLALVARLGLEDRAQAHLGPLLTSASGQAWQRQARSDDGGVVRRALGAPQHQLSQLRGHALRRVPHDLHSRR